MMAEVYDIIADETELRWFFEHVLQRPAVNESYSAVFVSRHKKLTKEQQEEIGLTRKEAEFLATVTFKLRAVKDAQSTVGNELWSFDNFVKVLRRLEVNKLAYTTAKGLPIPDTTLATIFYVNPCDDIKVCREFVRQYNDVNDAISKAMLSGKTLDANYQSYQWFGKADSTIKHLKANQKGARYWLDFDIDVPKWFKDGSFCVPPKVYTEYGTFMKDSTACSPEELTQVAYVDVLKTRLSERFGKGNYVIVDTSGGYHVLVRASAVHSNPHEFCKEVLSIYELGVNLGEEPYTDEKGVCKFECIVNDSQIPGIPLPGTYQYGRPVTVVNKDDLTQYNKQ